jgi:type VI secretion system secreted protein Hcp
MPCRGDIFIKNHEGSELEGSSADKSSPIFEYSHKVRIPFDPETNRVQGIRRLSGFQITKDIDRLTPQLYDMVCNGRNCTEVEIRLYRIQAESGEEEHYFSYLLENVKIVDVENLMPSTKIIENESLGHQERVTFLPEIITWKFLDGGIEYKEVNPVTKA